MTGLGNKIRNPDACFANADVIFALDASRSVGSENFEKTKQFLISVVAKLAVS